MSGGPLRPIALHGRMKQSAREAALAAFARGDQGAGGGGGAGGGAGGAGGAGGGGGGENGGDGGEKPTNLSAPRRRGSILLATDVAARGLDVPSVAWTLQYDPPSDPDAFVHRAGRAARAGARGGALLFLSPHESSYVEFLRNRGVPIKSVAPPQFVEPDPVAASSVAGKGSSISKGNGGEEENKKSKGKKALSLLLPPPPTAATINKSIRSAAVSDRETLEKATRAFVSHVRGYKEHACRFIFRSGELELGPLASSLGLPRLPRMPELAAASAAAAAGSKSDGNLLLPLSIAGFEPLEGFDPDTVKYKDKNREKVRQQRLAEERARRLERAEKEEERRKEKGGSSAVPPPPQSPPPPQLPPQRKLPAAKRRAAADARDEDDLLSDYTLLKRLKKGSISKEKFDAEFGRGGGGEDSDGDFDDDGSDDDEGERKRSSKKKKGARSSFGGASGRGGRGGGGGGEKMGGRGGGTGGGSRGRGRRRGGGGGFVPSRK